MSTRIGIAVVGVSLLLWLTAAVAMPPHQDVLHAIEHGDIEAPYAITHASELLERGVNAPASVERQNELEIVNFNSIVLMASFADNVGVTGGPFYDALFFNLGTGTVRDYYQEISYTEFNLTGPVLPSTIGWLMMPQLYSYYVAGQNGFGTYPTNCQKMAEDAVMLADPMVNFSQFDHDGDNIVDGLIIVHAGTDASWSGSPNDVWAHAWSLPTPYLTNDGVWVSNYAMVPEFWNGPGDLTIGVIAHEMGHSILGLPDLYDTDHSSYGLGNWSLMAYGSWNGPFGMGGSPAHLDAWCKMKSTMLTPYNVYMDMMGYVYPTSTWTPAITRMWTNGNPNNEYFLAEFRDNIPGSGYDVFLPGSGLLIYHVDDNVPTQNNQEWYPGYTNFGHYLVALEQADGLWDLEQSVNFGDPGDPYPGASSNMTFNPTSVPDSRNYGFMNTLVNLNSITYSNPFITANILVGNPPNPSPLVTVGLMPHIMPTIIPSGGGTFGFGATVTNNLMMPRTGQLWLEAMMPNGNMYLIQVVNRTFQPGVPINYPNLSQSVPAMAPPGPYQFILRAGRYPNMMIAQDMFPFTKQGWVPEGQEGPNDWAAIGWPADELANSYAIPFDAAPSELPEEYRIGQIYPNPFNEQATVEIALPTNAVLTVALYDVLGRQVSEVVSGWTPAGYHQFTIDASQLTSGVYFLRAEAGSHSATQKVALIR